LTPTDAKSVLLTVLHTICQKCTLEKEFPSLIAATLQTQTGTPGLE
jgi:hypothetical protein